MTTSNVFFNVLEAIDIDTENLMKKIPDCLTNRRNVFFVCAATASILGITYYAIYFTKKFSKPKDRNDDTETTIDVDEDLPPYLNKDF